MVSNVAKLTRAVRTSFMKKEGAGQTSSATLFDHKRNIIHQQLHQTGQAIFVDDHGNRYSIERRPA